MLSGESVCVFWFLSLLLFCNYMGYMRIIFSVLGAICQGLYWGIVSWAGQDAWLLYPVWFREWTFPFCMCWADHGCDQKQIDQSHSPANTVIYFQVVNFDPQALYEPRILCLWSTVLAVSCSTITLKSVVWKQRGTLEKKFLAGFFS